MVWKIKLHKSLMFNATENLLLSESIVLMCFCFPPVLGNGMELKYMHHGGRKELRLCLEQHVSKPVTFRLWNSLIFWPFHPELTSKLACFILWNESIREIYSRVLKLLDQFCMYLYWNRNALDQVLQFGHIMFALCQIMPWCFAPEEALCESAGLWDKNWHFWFNC